MWTLTLLTSILVLNTPASKCEEPAGVFSPGHIIIGGLFPIHTGVEQPGDFSQQSSTCKGFSLMGLAHSLVMVQAVVKANSSAVLGSLGVTLGYHIHDTCSDVTTALRATQDFTTPGNRQPVTTVIGADSSEISIAVARELNLHLVPQISYESTAKILSDKNRFPGFSRTVPSDEHQIRAMVKILRARNWTWVGVVTTDGDYGLAALESFVSQAAEDGICVAFKEILHDCLGDQLKVNSSVSHAVRTISANANVTAVVSFARAEHMENLLKGLMERNVSQKFWIASDSWSVSQSVVRPEELERLGWVLGLSFKAGDLTEVQEFVRGLDWNVEAQQNSFIKTFLSISANVSTATDELILSAQPGVVFSIQMAVNAVVHAVERLCKNRNCTDPGTVKPPELLQVLRNTSYQLDGISYRFDKNGDVDLGYDVSMWRKSNDRLETLNVVAQYNQNDASLNIADIPPNLQSRCSIPCEPGTFKKSAEGQHTCCYQCIKCPENQFSNHTDMSECYRCDNVTEWAESGSRACQKKTLEYFCWSDPLAILLLFFSGFGVMVVALVSVLFFWYRDSPVVKAAGGWLCQLILASLSVSFSGAVLFVGRPTDDQCKARQVLYGLSFTTCVSCILVKTLKILFAFSEEREHEAQRRLKKLYASVGVCVALQVIICTTWLVVKSPRRTLSSFSMSVLEECDEGSNEAFAVMLAYIALLALVCFILAYRGRKLPQKYNETKFITFGMLLYLIAWTIFIPIYVNTRGKYLPAVEMIVILISSYGTLSCHFLPKCYNMIFRKSENTVEAHIKNVQEYSKKNALNLKLPEPLKPHAASNPAFVPETTER
ncbi:G-protein coupled receptor family C group 6 member A [Trichomycterus rosablanca]|uniref:G-protein coupled receptor family C group 6 member A n=1 Tax=Trichomycterus rosablanca TaxID=2290929 RepID=UPI002F3555D8